MTASINSKVYVTKILFGVKFSQNYNACGLGNDVVTNCYNQ